MKVESLVRVGHALIKAEVELSLVPGLPNISIIGLPDQAIKESVLRIRSAIRAQGFELPHAQQILVHIKPTFQRKTSRGLDLAIAAALLWEMGQLSLPDETPVLYGELTLKGEVVQPDDLGEAPAIARPIITGKAPTKLQFVTRQIASLAELIENIELTKPADGIDFTRPTPTVKTLPRRAADFAKVSAAGEHSLLLVGPAGSGKSTLAENLPAWIEEPTFDTIKDVRPYWSKKEEALTWRPVLRPHHSITPLAMIGGGSSLWPGEITRAHGGVLFMDELLEFHPDIQEALREPVESGCISLVRAGTSRTYPARVLLVATSNLCACGNFVPRRELSVKCRCVKAVRQKILTRLTGPFVDRFAVIALTDEWNVDDSVPIEEIAQDIARAIAYRKARGQIVPNSMLTPEVIEDSLGDFEHTIIDRISARSRRRRAALLRVARTLADLRESAAISHEDLEQARILTVQTHRTLEEWT